jgi:hypothetical protein
MSDGNLHSLDGAPLHDVPVCAAALVFVAVRVPMPSQTPEKNLVIKNEHAPDACAQLRACDGYPATGTGLVPATTATHAMQNELIGLDREPLLRLNHVKYLILQLNPPNRIIL